MTTISNLSEDAFVWMTITSFKYIFFNEPFKVVFVVVFKVIEVGFGFERIILCYV